MKAKQIFVIIAFIVFTYAVTIVNLQETIGEIIVGYFILSMMAFDSITDIDSSNYTERRNPK